MKEDTWSLIDHQSFFFMKNKLLFFIFLFMKGRVPFINQSWVENIIHKEWIWYTYALKIHISQHSEPWDMRCSSHGHVTDGGMLLTAPVQDPQKAAYSIAYGHNQSTVFLDTFGK